MDDRLMVRLAAAVFAAGLLAVRALDGPRTVTIDSIPQSGAVRISGVVASVRPTASGLRATVRDASGEASVLLPNATSSCRPSPGAVVTLEGRVRSARGDRTVVAGEVRCFRP